MLTTMLETLDEPQILTCDGGRRPVLLLDGQHSRIKMRFLDYSNSMHTCGQFV
jgi:hypothetical protein